MALDDVSTGRTGAERLGDDGVDHTATSYRPLSSSLWQCWACERAVRVYAVIGQALSGGPAICLACELPMEMSAGPAGAVELVSSEPRHQDSVLRSAWSA
jgi:hypothetical protein